MTYILPILALLLIIVASNCKRLKLCDVEVEDEHESGYQDDTKDI